MRVVAIGAGNVGATFAYALLFRGLAAETVLIDANHARAAGVTVSTICASAYQLSSDETGLSEFCGCT